MGQGGWGASRAQLPVDKGVRGCEGKGDLACAPDGEDEGSRHKMRQKNRSWRGPRSVPCNRKMCNWLNWKTSNAVYWLSGATT